MAKILITLSILLIVCFQDFAYGQSKSILMYLTNGSYKHENLRRYTRQSIARCRIPTDSMHTTYKFVNNASINAKPGDLVENFSVLKISCDDGFGLNPINIHNKHYICIDGKWEPPLPNCLRTCPSLISIISTQVKCKWINSDGDNIPLPNCINPVEGTTAFLSCNLLYEEPSIEKNPFRVCREGKWDYFISECFPICGIKHPKGITNIINGTDTQPGDYPWQIGIYNAQKEFLCGGSILDNRVILSAAHCFTDTQGKVNPINNYLVAAGKYYRQYDDNRDKFAQYSKILRIYTPPKYRGQVNLQENDIAMIILTNPLNTSAAVLPVCIELNEESLSLHLSINKNGKVTGWGYTQGGSELADTLKEIVIPYIPYDECYQRVPENFRRYINHDKICGGYINESTSVCRGDSGGGLIFKKLNSDRHFIKGIVSVSPATHENLCDSNQYSVFTSVNVHIDFIRLLLAYNRIQQKIECTQNECLRNELMEKPPSAEDCSNSNDFTCRNTKINCTLPNFPLNGKYSLSDYRDYKRTYKPGEFVETNSYISLTCDIGFITNQFNTTRVFHCSDKGEWIPPLGTCLDKDKYCQIGNSFIKPGNYLPGPLGDCRELTCEDPKTGRLSSIGCAYFPGCEDDLTKLYPDCCCKRVHY